MKSHPPSILFKHLNRLLLLASYQITRSYSKTSYSKKYGHWVNHEKKERIKFRRSLQYVLHTPFKTKLFNMVEEIYKAFSY
ncbi:hypothetical protein FGO68_gene2774 [Halteria grandinella]|uniref:Uncharacterized protein n=1 Tax=Halteria grandinella TaxID=5974 RepID=A0A8J8P0F1_HALGN|nr:hypothetical protein FGO68_gene2774 [Halteria grandinella]